MQTFRNGQMAYRWGEKCPGFDPQCGVCQAWKRYEKTGRVPQLRTVEKLTSAANQDRVKR